MESDISWAVAVTITVPVTVVLVLVGMFLMEIARRGADGRLKRNRLAGLRSPATLRSDDAWLVGHEAGLADSIRGGTIAVAAALGSCLVPWFLAAIGVVGPDGLLFTWSAILLVGVVAMTLYIVRGFNAGNKAAKGLADS